MTLDYDPEDPDEWGEPVGDFGHPIEPKRFRVSMTVVFDPDEADVLFGKAERAGMTATAFIKKAVRDYGK